jgi:hypothetical protein
MSWRGGESMERLLLTTNYVSTKVSAISTKESETDGQNGMRGKGGGGKLDLDGGKEDEWLGSVVARWEVGTFLGGTS